MNFGISFPSVELSDPGAIKEYIQGAEELGFTQLTALEHTLGVRSSANYSPDQPIHEPMVLFAFMAAVTSRIRFTNSILILPQRQAILVARQAAEIDVLSDGRMQLGIGIGSNADEAAAMGTDYHTRGARVDEQIDLIRQLWTHEEVSFHGKWHDVEGGLMVLPVQRPIPIVMGGGKGERPLQRIGRLADGWIVPGNSPGETRSQLATIRAAAAAAGRDPNAIKIQGRLALSGGSPEDWLEKAESWKEIGATDVVVSTARSGFTQPSQHLDLAAQFMQETAPKL